MMLSALNIGAPAAGAAGGAGAAAGGATGAAAGGRRRAALAAPISVIMLSGMPPNRYSTARSTLPKAAWSAASACKRGERPAA